MGEGLSAWCLRTRGKDGLVLTWWHAAAPPGSRRLEKTALLQQLPRLLADGATRSALRGLLAEVSASGAAVREQWFGGVAASAPCGGARAERSDQLEPLRTALALAVKSGRLVGYELDGAGDAGGVAGIGKPHGPPATVPPPPEILKTIPPLVPPHKPVEPLRVETVDIVSVTVTSDHARMTQATDWLNDGEPFPEPEWEAGVSQPVSHTKGVPVGLRLELVIGPEGAAPRTGVLRGKGPGKLLFETPPTLLSAGPTTVEVTSQGALPDRVSALSLAIHWSVEPIGDEDTMTVTPSGTAIPMYLTFGPPKDDFKGTGASSYEEVGADIYIMSHLRACEDGATLKRMKASVSWVGQLEDQSLHAVAKDLVRRVHGYTLIANKNVPKEYEHPSYRNLKLADNACVGYVGGAWPLWEFTAYKAECQAIVRLARAIMRQLGAPADPRMVSIWADPLVKEGTTALEADWEAIPEAGLDRVRWVNGVKQMAALVDNAVDKGEIHTYASAGINRFEACLKLEAEGKTRYYPGGTTNVLGDPNEVLGVFWGLVWMHRLEGEEDSYVIDEVVQKWAK